MTNACGNAFVVGVSALLLANTVPGPGPLQYTVQYSALGILGWAVWYMLARMIPRILKAQQEERQMLLDAHAREQEITRRDYRDALGTLLEIVKSPN
jgi:hypothetical protein